MLFLIFKAISNFQVGKHWPLDFDFRRCSRRWSRSSKLLVFLHEEKNRENFQKFETSLVYAGRRGEERTWFGEDRVPSKGRGGRKERGTKLKHVSAVIEGNAARNSFHGFRKR